MFSLYTLAMRSIVNCFPDRLDEFSKEDGRNLKNIVTYPSIKE